MRAIFTMAACVAFLVAGYTTVSASPSKSAAEKKPIVTVKKGKDEKTAVVTFPASSLTLNAKDIDTIISALGEFRKTMSPEVQPDYALGQQNIPAIIDPKWATESDTEKGDSLLHIRDPRYGWVHYLIPRDTAAKLAAFLKTQSSSPQQDKPFQWPH